MKPRTDWFRKSTWIAVLAGCVAIVALITACEDDPDMGDTSYFDNPYRSDARQDVPVDKDALTLSPGTIQVTMPDQKFTLQVSGGYPPYTWRVSDTDTGLILPNDASSDTAIYKAISLGNNSIIVTDSGGRSAQCQVARTTTLALDLVPDDASLQAGSGDTVQFTATGGYPPYTWVVALPGLGGVTDGLYKDASPGGIDATNLVSVIDSQGTVESAQIIITP